MDNLALLQHQQRFNKAAAKWGFMTRNEFLFNLFALPFDERKMWQGRNPNDILRDKVGIGFKKQYGDIIAVKWPFARHGIFQEHGVGKGRKKGSSKVRPMPWIVETLDAQTPLLANMLKDEGIKSLGLVIHLKVNGLFELRLNP